MHNHKKTHTKLHKSNALLPPRSSPLQIDLIPLKLTKPIQPIQSDPKRVRLIYGKLRALKAPKRQRSFFLVLIF